MIKRVSIGFAVIRPRNEPGGVHSYLAFHTDGTVTFSADPDHGALFATKAEAEAEAARAARSYYTEVRERFAFKLEARAH